MNVTNLNCMPSGLSKNESEKKRNRVLFFTFFSVVFFFSCVFSKVLANQACIDACSDGFDSAIASCGNQQTNCNLIAGLFYAANLAQCALKPESERDECDQISHEYFAAALDICDDIFQSCVQNAADALNECVDNCLGE